MTEAEPDDLAEDENVDLLELLSSEVWIGLSWAVDWIAFRGSPISHLDEKSYNAQLYSAAKDIIKHLAQYETDLKQGEELPLAKGVWEGSDGQDAYTKGPVWSNASIDVDDYDQGYYVLDLTGSDVDDGSTGALVARERSWHRIRVLSQFILKEWPPASAGITRAEKNPDQHTRRGRPSHQRVDAKIIEICKECPPELAPPPYDIMHSILKQHFPDITIEMSRELYRAHRKENNQPGPKGKRIHDRAGRYEEFRRKMQPS